VPAGARPPDKPRDQRDVDDMRTAAFRVLLRNAHRSWPRTAMPPGTPFCLAFDIARDPPPEMLARLRDLRYVLKPLSECARENRIFQEAGILTGPYNKLALGAVKWTSQSEVEIETEAFAGSCRVTLTRTRKG
jgi:hypothetical protein